MFSVLIRPRGVVTFIAAANIGAPRTTPCGGYVLAA